MNRIANSGDPEGVNLNNIGDLSTFLDPARAPRHEYLGLNPEWKPLAAGDRRLSSDQDTVNWFQQPKVEQVVEEGRSNLDEPSSEENFQDQYERIFQGQPPPIFIPMRFRLPDLPMKLPKQRQLELDEGLSLYLPKTLLDAEFKTQLEEEIIRLMPTYAEVDRYFGAPDPQSAPRIDDRDRWIVHKRYSKLCIKYKHQQQRLRQYLHQKWKQAIPEYSTKMTNTMFELSTYRRSRPDWRSYVQFVRTFSHRYDFLPKLIQAPLKNPPVFPPAGKLMAYVHELNLAKSDPTKCQREFAKPLLTQYKTLRMTRRIAKRKAKLAAEAKEDKIAAAKKKERNARKQYIMPAQMERVKVVEPQTGPKTFLQRIREIRRILVERQKQKTQEKQTKSSKKNTSDVPVISCDTAHEQRKDERLLRREARRKVRRREYRIPHNPFRVHFTSPEQLYLGGDGSECSSEDSDELRRRTKEAAFLEDFSYSEPEVEVKVTVPKGKSLAERTKELKFRSKSRVSGLMTEATWRKRQKTEETKNFKKILRKNGTDPTSRTLHREGMTTTQRQVPVSGILVNAAPVYGRASASARRVQPADRSMTSDNSKTTDAVSAESVPAAQSARTSGVLKSSAGNSDNHAVPSETSLANRVNTGDRQLDTVQITKNGVPVESDLGYADVAETKSRSQQQKARNIDPYGGHYVDEEPPQLSTDTPGPRRVESPWEWRHPDDPKYQHQSTRKVSDQIRRGRQIKSNELKSVEDITYCEALRETEWRTRHEEQLVAIAARQKAPQEKLILSAADNAAPHQKDSYDNGKRKSLPTRQKTRSDNDTDTVIEDLPNSYASPAYTPTTERSDDSNPAQTGISKVGEADVVGTNLSREPRPDTKQDGIARVKVSKAAARTTKGGTKQEIPNISPSTKGARKRSENPKRAPLIAGATMEAGANDSKVNYTETKVAEEHQLASAQHNVETKKDGATGLHRVTSQTKVQKEPADFTESSDRLTPISSRHGSTTPRTALHPDTSTDDLWQSMSSSSNDDNDQTGCPTDQLADDQPPHRLAWRSLRRHRKRRPDTSLDVDKICTIPPLNRKPVKVTDSTAALMYEQKAHTGKTHSVLTMMRKFDRLFENKTGHDRLPDSDTNPTFACADYVKEADDVEKMQERREHKARQHPRYYTAVSGVDGAASPGLQMGNSEQKVGREKVHFPPKLLTVWRASVQPATVAVEESSDSLVESVKTDKKGQVTTTARRRKKDSKSVPKFMRKWKKVLSASRPWPRPAE